MRLLPSPPNGRWSKDGAAASSRISGLADFSGDCTGMQGGMRLLAGWSAGAVTPSCCGLEPKERRSPMAKQDDRTALITGATDGVGRVVAKKLGEAGMHVFLHGRDRQRGERVAEEIRKAGGKAEFL